MTEESKRKIEALKHCSSEENWCYECPAADDCVNSKKTTRRTIAKMALEVIYELGRELEEYKDSLSDSVRVIVKMQARLPKWIPVTEGLPEPCVAVLVMYKQENDTPHRHMAYLNHRGKWVGLELTGEVTAWHPLPKPYYGEA